MTREPNAAVGEIRCPCLDLPGECRLIFRRELQIGFRADKKNEAHLFLLISTSDQDIDAIRSKKSSEG
jgi:hypothetical protein